MGLFQCPFCESLRTRVKETTQGTPLTRVRICPECGKRFRTAEVYLDRDAESYLDIVSRMSADKMVERFIDVISSRTIMSAITERLKKKAGLKIRDATSPSEMFTP